MHIICLSVLYNSWLKENFPAIHISDRRALFIEKHENDYRQTEHIFSNFRYRMNREGL